jgi:hypothetical protein
VEVICGGGAWVGQAEERARGTGWPAVNSIERGRWLHARERWLTCSWAREMVAGGGSTIKLGTTHWVANLFLLAAVCLISKYRNNRLASTM